MTFVAARRIDLRPVRARRSRLLQNDGRIVAMVGEMVDAEKVVARGPRRTEPIILDAAQELGVGAREVERYLQRKAGQTVGLDEVVATKSGPLGLRPRVVRAPVAGLLREFLPQTGEIVLLPDGAEEEVRALLPGSVVAHVGRRGVIVETAALGAEGLVGVGPLVSGPLVPIGDGPDHVLRADDLGPQVRGGILLVGAISADAVVAAYHARVAGILAGTCSADDWAQIVQLTTAPTAVVLEGLGDGGLSGLAWDGFRPYGGRAVILDARREHPEAAWPELLLPVEAPTSGAAPSAELVPGARVRLARGALAPRVGEVVRVGRFPARLASGLEQPWVEVEVDGRRHRVSQRAIEFVAPAQA
ncbi:MAG TPA: hypothetical protein VNL16_19700 [Chloroflexota bacterium]|nr:hypothetical protein [Chloroflexota bacterium]